MVRAVAFGIAEFRTNQGRTENANTDVGILTFELKI
jgi:hypothetical protein